MTMKLTVDDIAAGYCCNRMKEKQSNENNVEEENNTFSGQRTIRKLMVKLSDLSYIHIKAAKLGVDKRDPEDVIERDFWLPLDGKLIQLKVR